MEDEAPKLTADQRTNENASADSAGSNEGSTEPAEPAGEEPNHLHRDAT